MPRRHSLETAAATILALIAFAGNSLLCRVALKSTTIDPATFTTIRVVSGALVLAAMARTATSTGRTGGSWGSGAALFIYAACFSFAYVGLPTATGALLLFSAVQATMIGYGIWTGERLVRRQWSGLLLSLAGLLVLFAPGLAVPSPGSSILMVAAGIAWGAYSLRGRGTINPLRATAGNFLRAVPLSVGLSVALITRSSWDMPGVGLALASGVLTSAIGYAIWFRALSGLRAATAASAQLSVPVIAAVGAVLLLGEPLTLHLAVAAIAVLAGNSLVILARH